MKSFLSPAACFFFIMTVIVQGCRESNEKEVASDDSPRRIELLFLGHSLEHHNSAEYFPILASALTRSGINMTYTESPEDLTPSILERYDGLILYANHDQITADQEKALMEFVEGGHAFIPLHCASYCFRNSEDFVTMVGGQFKEHGTGTFTATITDKDHPITESLSEFSTWDETYVHDHLNDDMHVLMERVEGDHREPYTWVREQGAGKVFYTAYGHDERTWTHPGFQELVKQGILWAVNEGVRENWNDFVADIPELEYEVRDNIPNYEKREAPLQYQMPLSPEESAKLMQVPPGFDLELFASEPDIINPIAMNWDERGRLWVVETVDYPNTVRDDKSEGDDRIKILEDTDNDGKADKITVFAERLNIPTSFAFWDGGIVVSQAPHFLFLKDTNGDDKADVKEIMIDGWGVFDTHAGPSNLQYGIDNMLYGVVGYSGFQGVIFGNNQEFRQGVYRFDPKKKNFELVTNTSNNTWGLGLTEGNSLFASTANNTHSVYVGIPNAYFEGISGLEPSGSAKIDGHYAMLPITPNIRQVDVFGGFTAAAGHHFYTARDYPSNYWNKIAFVCEPTGGVVHQARIVKSGAGYREVDGGNLLASSDEWVSPVEAKVGPDGAVWVLDWYNFIVQHNPTPTVERGGYDASNGEGNAHINPLRDRSHGRIWRVVPKKNREDGIKTLDRDEPEALVNALSDDNMFWRLTAQRLLVERGETDVVNDLFKLVNDESVDAVGLNPAALHALWTLEGLGVLQRDQQARAVVRGALFHPSPSVRRAAIQLMPRTFDTDEAILLADALHDADPEVQLAALLYFSERPPSESIGRALYELSQQGEVKEDPWLAKGVYLAAAHHAPGFMAEYTDARKHGAIKEGVKAEDEKFDGARLAETLAENYGDRLAAFGTVTGEGAEGTATIEIKTIVNELKYDVTEFVVEAGQQVEIVFENNDFMQHNIVIVQPGEKEKVGQAADRLAMEPDGASQNYVPDMPEVLFNTNIVDPQGRAVLRFTAPAEPGEYAYICTFPGHWRIMQGVMRVVGPS